MPAGQIRRNRKDNGNYVTDSKEFESSMQISCSPGINGQVIQRPSLLTSEASDSNFPDKPLTARPVHCLLSLYLLYEFTVGVKTMFPYRKRNTVVVHKTEVKILV